MAADVRVAFVNGRYRRFDEACVHIEDRGLQFADSVYEAFAVIGGRLLDAAGHWARLERSLGEIRQPMPMSVAAFSAHARELLKRNRVRDGLIYLQVTRGVARRDHPFPPAGTPQGVIMTARKTDWAKAHARAAQGVAVITHPDLRWARRDVKTTGLLPNALAKQAAREAGAYEAWLVDEAGRVTEGSSSNAWIVTREGEAVTRDLSHALLPGVTRASVSDLARAEGLRVVERAFTPREALEAREAFMTSAGSFVTPIVAIDGQPVGDGRPGEITLRLRRAYLAAAATG